MSESDSSLSDQEGSSRSDNDIAPYSYEPSSSSESNPDDNSANEADNISSNSDRLTDTSW